MDLVIVTIYQHPADYPDGFVVRPWTITGGDEMPGTAQYADTLSAARLLIPVGAMRLERQPDDDTTIVESWLL